MRIAPRSIEQTRESADIVEVVSEFTALRRQGANLVGLCPYPEHSEKTPSFTVYPEKGFCYCYGCQTGADAIKLVMDLKSFPFVEAVSHLAERFGVELEFEGRSPRETKHAEQRAARRRATHKALAAAAAYYHKYLLKSPAAEGARRYLEERGMERSTIEDFRLGYAPPRGSSGFLRAASGVGLGAEDLSGAGLISPRGGERFVDRVTFPISDRRGKIVGFGARALGDAKPKYLNSPETEIFNKRSLLYGFPQVAEAVRKERAALVVEGYTDVLMLYQSGIKNVVATLGTAMTEQHLKTLSGLADRIYLLFDPDDAGKKAVEKVEGVADLTFAATKLNAFLYVVALPEDPADWLLHHSPDEFGGFLDNAVSIVDYTIRSLAEQARGRDAATRHRTMPKILEYVQKVGTRAPTLELEAKRLAADALQVSSVRLESLLASQGAPAFRLPSSAGAPPPKVVRRTDDDPLVEAGRELLAIALARPDLASRALSEGMEASAFLEKPVKLESGDFGAEAHARIFTLLAEDPEGIRSDERARPLLDEISALRALGERLYPSEASLRAAWFRLAALNRAQAKLRTEDFDEKYRLHTEMKQLARAAAESSSLASEP